jgi:hypothetical protein
LEQHLRNFIQKQTKIKQKQQVNRLKKNASNLTNLVEMEGEDEDDCSSFDQEEEGPVRGIQLSQQMDITLGGSCIQNWTGSSQKGFGETDAHNYR